MLTKEENELDPGRAGHARRRDAAAVLVAGRLQRSPDYQAAEGAAAGRGILLFRDGRGRSGCSSWAARTRRIARVRPRGGLRYPLLLPRLAVRHRRAAVWSSPRSRGQHLQGPRPSRAYPVQERGLIFAYLGPEPAPLLPNYDLLCRDDGVRTLWGFVGYCNWLQQAENTVDQAHLAWLHAGQYPAVATSARASNTSARLRREGHRLRSGRAATQDLLHDLPLRQPLHLRPVQNTGNHRATGPDRT